MGITVGYTSFATMQVSRSKCKIVSVQLANSIISKKTILCYQVEAYKIELFH